ncbi:BsaWI family type II restriction enzyme [Ruminiclostridium papyrosolvens]|uniref:BsaWI restriction endonuclease type 2 domain-containing protein n=1 Tax=Ruminiclostridium papyrosolvens C7 TaxID=1330534 RepID=U4QXS7_9FIRM|nr:BsaWI family type II restriction enzyme [Ruminiclostridium papyrosolvens]EPR07800.1 hypothetical protein L323_20105 [Ruminiclostridium papyrosolvens C7]
MPNISIDDANNEYAKILSEKTCNISGTVTDKKIASLRTDTIHEVFSSLVSKFPGENPGHVWRMVQKAHINSYIDNKRETIKTILQAKNIDEDKAFELLTDDELLSIFDSATQSWKRASGIAWENFFRQGLTLGDNSGEIIVVNDSMMNKLFKGGSQPRQNGEEAELHISNDSQRSYIGEILKSKNFDLFLLYLTQFSRKWTLFGLIQCKTSIRDRVKINTSSSRKAMDNNLWSILLALDPDYFLKGQYYKAAKEDWHGVYLIDEDKPNDDSIYFGSMDRIQELIKNHALQVLEMVTDINNSNFNANWRPR